MKLEFSKASRILTRPSRLRSAGAVSRFLNKEPAAYDFNLMEPRLRGQKPVLCFDDRELPGGN